MNALNELEEIKELVNADKKFKYKNIINFNCDTIKEELNYADKCHSLEEQLGCPLEVVFKAIYSGIYYIYPNGNIGLERSFKLNHYSSGWCLIKPKLNFKLEDYKKTWWLKKDKSE